MCRAGSGQEFSPGASERQLPGGVPSLSTDQFNRGAGPGAKGCSGLAAFRPHCLVRTQPCAVLFFLVGLGASQVRSHRV